MSTAALAITQNPTVTILRRELIVKENLSNVGKKEQRQINQLLNKQAKEGRQGVKDVEARTVPKQHKLKKQKSK